MRHDMRKERPLVTAVFDFLFRAPVRPPAGPRKVCALAATRGRSPHPVARIDHRTDQKIMTDNFSPRLGGHFAYPSPSKY